MISLAKLKIFTPYKLPKNVGEKIFTPLQTLPKNVGDWGKLIVATGFEKLPKVQ